jgi:hypothetical protein
MTLEISNDTIVRLYELCWGDHPRSIGTLATAVEMHGIYGLDRFGRVVKFQGDKSTEGANGIKIVPCQPVLDALAQEYRQRLDDAAHQRQLVRALRANTAKAADTLGPSVLGYFWLRSELPDFDAIEAGLTQPPLEARNAAHDQKARNNLLALVGALIEFASGVTTGTPHREWGGRPSDRDDHSRMRSLLIEHYPQTPGFTENHLRRTFKSALERLQEAGDSSLRRTSKAQGRKEAD